LESPSARSRLKRGRQPHWKALVEGKVHLGWQCWKGDAAGRWVLRRYIGKHKSAKGNPIANDKPSAKDKLIAKYRISTLGLADDADKADGVHVLSYKQAEDKARAMVAAPNGGKVVNLTVRQAMERYVDYKRACGQPVDYLLSRSNAHILPELGDLVVSELTAEVLRKWLAAMAAAPAQKRPKAGKTPQYRPAPVTDEDVRRRRSSANRVLTMLKAALNHAFDEEQVPTRDAWGRKLKPFRKVDVARVRYLQVAEAQRLINACDPDFCPLVHAALETGCRYGELIRLEVQDFNADAGTVTIRKSKSGKPRHVVLTDEGEEFFRQHCAGLGGGELMFRRANGSAWKTSEQNRRMRAACAAGRITPAISFHILRHTWASLAVMAGMPLMVVAQNLGHADTRMVEKHYGHLGRSFITDAIRASAPRYGIKVSKRVVPLR
jgi:integrase